MLVGFGVKPIQAAVTEPSWRTLGSAARLILCYTYTVPKPRRLPMSSLADLPELVGFFSYSRRDDEHSQGSLSRLRARMPIHLQLQSLIRVQVSSRLGRVIGGVGPIGAVPNRPFVQCCTKEKWRRILEYRLLK
jgi:hypothetical protein